MRRDVDSRFVPQIVTSDIEPLTPDEAIDELDDLDLELGDGAPDLAVDEEPTLPTGRSWAFDWSAGRFIASSGGPLTTNDRETLRFWIEKALRTPRGAFVIYDNEFGVEDPNAFIGEPADALTPAEATTLLQDALTFHPRITDVTDVEVVSDPATDDFATVSFTVVLDDDTTLPFDIG